MVVEDILKSKNIEYRHSGKDYLIRCLSPDHEDRNPSLRVDKTTGIFNCLSCGFSGNIFNHFGERPDWLQIFRDKVSKSILAKLADSSGLSIPENAVPFTSDWRNISGETYRRFRAFQHNSSEFIGRVVFPITDISGKIVAFCGRHQSQGTPKYLFSPSGVENIPLFPVVKPISGRILLVEGIMDMINLQDKGITNAVCAFGVNKLTKEKINVLKIQGIKGIDIFYDMDEAGRRASEISKKDIENCDMACSVVSFTGAKDPGELTASQVLKIKEKLKYG